MPLPTRPLRVDLANLALLPRCSDSCLTVTLPLAYTIWTADSSGSVRALYASSPTMPETVPLCLRTRDVMLFSSVSSTEESFGSEKTGSLRKKLAISS